MDNIVNNKPLLLKGLLISCGVLSLIALSAALVQINTKFKTELQKAVKAEEINTKHGEGKCVTLAYHNQQITEKEYEVSNFDRNHGAKKCVPVKIHQKMLQKQKEAVEEQYKGHGKEKCVPVSTYENDIKTAVAQYKAAHGKCVSQANYDNIKKKWQNTQSELKKFKAKHEKGKCISLEEHQKKIASISARRADVENSSAPDNEELNAKIKELNAKIKELNAKNENLEKDVYNLLKKLDNRREKLKQVQEENKKLKDENESLKRQVDSLKNKQKNKKKIPAEPSVPRPRIAEPKLTQLSKKKLSECYDNIYVTVNGKKVDLPWIKSSFFSGQSIDLQQYENIYISYHQKEIKAFYYQDGQPLMFYVERKSIPNDNTLTEGLPVRLECAYSDKNIFLHLPEGFKVTPIKQENEWIQIELFQVKDISFMLNEQ